MGGAAPCVKANDLVRGVDGLGEGGNAAWGVDRRVGAVAVKEAVGGDAIAVIIPGDVPRSVDRLGEGGRAAWDIGW